MKRDSFTFQTSILENHSIHRFITSVACFMACISYTQAQNNWVDPLAFSHNVVANVSISGKVTDAHTG
ncbi:MAG TPA: hypothetical protein VFV68_17235, partial [Agriterribacter sp.]|nr:hypothetical protein [Agriterribacter sp.]